MDLTAVQAIAAAILGGIGAKLWDLFVDRRRARKDDNAAVKTAEIGDLGALRKEMWDEIGALRIRSDTMQEEIDTSRGKYAELLLEHIELKARHNQLEHVHEVLQGKYEIVKHELDALREQRL